MQHLFAKDYSPESIERTCEMLRRVILDSAQSGKPPIQALVLEHLAQILEEPPGPQGTQLSQPEIEWIRNYCSTVLPLLPPD